MNKETFEGKFKELAGDLKRKWGELTDDELRRTKGNIDSLIGVIQQKYGAAREQIKKELTDITSRFEPKAQAMSDDVNKKIDDMKDTIKDKVSNNPTQH